MKIENTWRGNTQEAFYTGEKRLFASPLEGEGVRRTEEEKRNKLCCATPLPAFGHPLPQGARMTTCGFTLIELLVVVLIIGILAAVALPQYQKAVAKSRFAALKPIAKSIKDAEEIYYNEHGNYGELADLEVQAPAGSVSVSETTGHDYVRASSSSGNRYTVYFNHSDNFAGNVYCEAEQDNAVANAVCVAEQGVDVELVQDGHNLYLMSGNSTGSFPYKLMSKTGSYPYYTYTYSNGTETIEVMNRGTVFIINGVNYSASPSYDVQYPGREFAVLCERYSFIEACN